MYAGLRKRVLSNRLSRLQRSTVRKKPMTHPRSNLRDSDQNNQNNSENSIELPLYENVQHFEPIGEETEENNI